MNIDVNALMIEMARAKVTIKELSEKAEVSRSTIAAIKKGGMVRPDIAGKLAAALGVSVNDILEKTEINGEWYGWKMTL